MLKSKFTKEHLVQLLLSNHLQKKVACLYFDRELKAAPYRVVIMAKIMQNYLWLQPEALTVFLWGH